MSQLGTEGRIGGFGKGGLRAKAITPEEQAAVL